MQLNLQRLLRLKQRSNFCACNDNRKSPPLNLIVHFHFRHQPGKSYNCSFQNKKNTGWVTKTQDKVFQISSVIVECSRHMTQKKALVQHHISFPTSLCISQEKKYTHKHAVRHLTLRCSSRHAVTTHLSSFHPLAGPSCQ